uniref:Uncharacterized protein n=1 Tax=Helianthus annuus TaxID=4232 RepID=A0A251UBK1_HELAN
MICYELIVHLSTTSSRTIIFLQRLRVCLNQVVFTYLWSMWLPKMSHFLKFYNAF